MSPSIKKGPKRKPIPCGWCSGSGQEPVDHNDRRKGTKTCHRCNGAGEL